MRGTDAVNFQDVQRRCKVKEDINRHPIESWIASAKNLYRTAQISEEAHDAEEAYVFYSRVYEICVNMIPSHRDYAVFKKSPSTLEAYHAYSRFRSHLGADMDNYIALRQAVKDSFKSIKVPVPVSSGPDSYPRPVMGTSRLMASNSSRLADLTLTSSRRRTTQAKDEPQPQKLRPILSKTVTIEVPKVLEYISRYPDLALLFLDIRPRDEYNRSCIDHPNVVNIDPLVCRAGSSSQDIEDAFVICPQDEMRLFENRFEFDLLLLYDAQSKSFSVNEPPIQRAHRDALQNLLAALWERSDWRKPLARSPVLLVGGLEAWRRAGGSTRQPVRSSRSSSYSASVESTESLSLVLQQPKDSQPDLDAKKKNRMTTVVESGLTDLAYPRSIQEYISSFSSQQQSMKIAPRTPTLQNGSQPNSPATPANKITTSIRPNIPVVPILSKPVQSPLSSPYLESRDPVSTHRQHGLPAYARQPSLGSQTSRLGQTTIGKTGLKNLGNSCFMNAVLQCLAACFPLARYFTSGQWRSDVSVDNPLGYKGMVAKQFALLLRELSSDDNSVIAPVDLRVVIGRSRPEFARGDQQDAQELMNFLLDALHEDLNANAMKPQLRELTEAEEFHRETLPDSFVSETEWKRHVHRNMSVIVKLFQGQLQSRLKCRHCGHTSTTYNAFTTLSLPIPAKHQKVSLEDCVEEFVKAEAMEDDDSWFCAKCKVKRNASKKLSISKLPDVLLVHFKRFESRGPWRDKLNTDISFPLSGLDMSKFLGSNVQPHAAVRTVYDLFGVVYHRGSMEGGHYTAIVNPESRRSQQDWTLFDDSRVAPSTGVDGKAAYLLFYSKRADML